MADKEDQFGTCSSESAMTTNPDHSWTQQAGLPLWCLKNDSKPLSEGGHRSRDDVCEDSSRKSSAIIDDAEDESGLELSLGLSLGGPVSKPKPRNGQKDGIGVEQRGGGGEKVNDETSARKLSRRDSDGSVSRTQAFWQEFDISRDNQQDEKPSHLSSDAHLRERHPSSVSSLSSPISSLSSIGLSDTWRSAESSVGEDSKVAVAHQFWQSMHEKPLQTEQGNGKEELPIFQALSGPSPHSAAASSPWARYGQSGVAMPLLDGFKETGEENSRTPFPVSVKDNKIPIASVPGENIQHGGDGGPLQQPKGGDGLPYDEIGLQASDPRHAQETLEQQRKQKKQEARKRRKACMEEQKLQKKAKKEDEGRVVTGPTSKHTSSRSGTPPPGAKVSPSAPQQVNTREVSSPPDSQEAGSASSGFRRTSSGMWSRAGGGAWDGAAVSSPEKTPEKELDQGNDEGMILEIRLALKRERDRATKEKVWEVDREKEIEPRQDSERRSPADGSFGQTCKVDEGSGLQPVGAVHSPHENPTTPPAATSQIGISEMNKGQADAAWVQRMLENAQMNSYQMAAALMENKELLQGLKGLPDLNGIQRRGLENLPSAVDRDRLKAFGVSTSEQGDKSSERIRFEMRISDAKTEAANRSNPVLAGGSHPASGSMMAYSQPSNFPLMHMAYPFPVPVGAPNGLPFSLPYPFPYMMQFAPSADSSSAQERTGTPTLPNSFPGTSNHLPYSVVGDLPPSWAPVLRPQATPPHSPPRTLARSSSGVTDEDSRNSQGAKSNDTVRSASPVKDATSGGPSHTLMRATSLGSGQGQGGAFSRLRASPNLPPTPQFGPIRTRSESGEAILYREGGSVTSNSAFASLVAAVEASQGLSAAVASVNTSSKQPASQRIGGLAKLERTTSRVLSEAMEEITGASISSKGSSQQGETTHVDSVSRTSSNAEEVKVSNGNRFQQGTTTSTSLSEGLISQMGQEASFFKAGCAAGQMFGGSGTSPDLPWVTCKGAGPNGKAISGVLYKYNKGQVRIVCACHGRHMSPSEFVQHAGSEDLSNPEKSIVVGPFPHGGQAASAQG